METIIEEAQVIRNTLERISCFITPEEFKRIIARIESMNEKLYSNDHVQLNGHPWEGMDEMICETTGSYDPSK